LIGFKKCAIHNLLVVGIMNAFEVRGSVWLSRERMKCTGKHVLKCLGICVVFLLCLSVHGFKVNEMESYICDIGDKILFTQKKFIYYNSQMILN